MNCAQSHMVFVISAAALNIERIFCSQVEATGAVMSKMNADLESGAKDRERLQNLLAAEQHRSAGLGAHLNAAKRRLRDLEV